MRKLAIFQQIEVLKSTEGVDKIEKARIIKGW